MPSTTRMVTGAIVYGLLVFLGAAGLGFLAVPAIAYAAGLFTIDTEARATFSFITLEALPFLWGLSVPAAFSYEWIMRLSIAGRAAAYLGTAMVTWVAGAAIAVFILG
ncbi:MAG TPA: hypothetical protein VII78_04000 [Myxococcota bacterium]